MPRSSSPQGRSSAEQRQAISSHPHYGPSGTFTGFDIARMDASPIDHIFVSDDVTVLRHATLTQQTGGEAAIGSLSGARRPLRRQRLLTTPTFRWPKSAFASSSQPPA